MLQVLVTTMYQKDFSIVKEMNLQTDAVITNQADENRYDEMYFENKRIQMVTTCTRGTSVNRNMAIAFISKEADYVMFSDDDLCFVNNYEKIVCNEFKIHPEADAIMFSIENTGDWNLGKLASKKFRKATRRSVTASGVWGVVFKKTVLLKKNLHFNQFFGPGTDYYSGEDTIFLQDVIKSKMNIYMSPTVIAEIDQSESTWFEGFTDKYYIVKGAILAATYPGIAKLLAIRSAYRMSKKRDCTRKMKELFKLYKMGIEEYRKN